MENLAPWPLVPLIALAVPATLWLTALAAPGRAALASGASLALALLFTLGTAGGGPGAAPGLGVRVDATTCIMLLLVTALGVVVVRFSQDYLDGDGGRVRCLRWLLLTLSAVTALVASDNLLVMSLCWTATSVALHQLLTFFGDRPAALVAAHKKFLVSRLADCCLAVCLVLVHANVGSFDLDHIAAWADARPDLPSSMEVAAVLLVVAVALRSAQLPFHGWITQVMEAPTPVSALLHAGVVNIGGLVLIRLAPWIAQAVPAQLLLVVIGLLSATLAALIMTTRVSVKVALAWSTCAQMGFMLVQCGLGLWPLALLHLVAHSFYKAHAFLSAGSAVDDWRVKALSPKRPPLSALRLGAAVSAAIGCLLLGVTVVPPLIGLSASERPADLVLGFLLALGLVPLLATRAASGALGGAAVALQVTAMAILYFGSHALGERAIAARVEEASMVGWILAGLGFLGLFAAKSVLQLRPDGRFARAIHAWLFSGLYLDELFTRLTFRVWPPRLPSAAKPAARANHAPATLGVQA